MMTEMRGKLMALHVSSCIRVAFCNEFFPRSLGAASFGKIRRDLFSIAPAIGRP